MKLFLMVFFKVNAAFCGVYFEAANERAEIKKEKTKKPEIRKTASKKKSSFKLKTRTSGNLPFYAQTPKSLNFKVGEFSKSVSGSNYVLSKILSGDTFKLGLEQTLYAIEDDQVKISGVIQAGPLMGARVLGHSKLEKYSKNIVLSFTRLQMQNGEEFEITAQGRTREEGLFLKPSKYFSKKRKWLLVHVLTAFASSFLESKIRVNQTLLGNTQNTDLKSSGYAAGKEGTKVISEHFRDALNNSKDVALIAEPRMYRIRFLKSPIQHIGKRLN